MQSTFAGIEIGKRGLTAHTQGLTTIGHNMSNASVEGYSRQRVEMKAMDPLYMPGLNREMTPGQIGQGVTVQRVERIKDMILEGRIVGQANARGYWEARDRYVLMLEQVYNEPTELSLRGRMDQFWESWQELSMHPNETAVRQSILQRGEAFIDSVNQKYRSLTEIRQMLDEEVRVTVQRINEILRETAGINEQIVKIEAMGDNPNDLLDQRDRLVRELSGLVDITTDGRDPDEFTIHSGGLHLLQGRIAHLLEAEPDPQNEGYSDVVWADSGENTGFRGGKLPALLELRDVDTRGEIQRLDYLAINFGDMVNEIHRDGYGLNGETGLDFFTQHPFINNVAGNYDRDGDGAYDSSYIFRVSGVNQLEPQQQIGLQGTLQLAGPEGNVEVEYFPTDSVEDVVRRINLSGAEVEARLDREGQLTLKAAVSANRENPDFVIRHIEDSGQFLVGYAGILAESGAAGAFDWQGADAVLSFRGGGTDYAVAPLSHPAGWMELNGALTGDPGAVAAGFGENGRPAMPGDGSTATAIASLRNSEVMLGGVPGFDEFFAETVASIGLRGETAEKALETENLIMEELEGMQSAVSGVNMDEELAQMIKYQHGYNAAARFVSEINQMLDLIINRMGV